MTILNQEKLKEDLKEFHQITAKFYKKEITVSQYKSFSGGFGSYAQRGGERSMLRLRLVGGEITMDNLKFIVDSIKKHHVDMLHLTTCETVQLHNLTEETVCELVEEAWNHNIITRGGGGDFPRNVMCSPLSGVEEGEYFSVMPYAREVSDYLLGLIDVVKLPRKLKVCFSNGTSNETHATFRDLGFVAKENQTFDVYIAGGLGIKPKMGVLVAEDVEPAKVLYVVKTMVDIFTKYGNYENRAASRSRFLQDSLGVEQLQAIFKEQLADNLEKENLTITVKEDAVNKEGSISGEEEFLKDNKRVKKQKQKGLYSVSYHPIGGSLAPEFFVNLYEGIKAMEEVKLRLTPTQGMYIINLTQEEAKQVLELTKDGARNTFEASTACIGADICQVGIGKSQALLKACVERVRKEDFREGVLPSIHISGCPSSCSAHQTAQIGFRGGKKPTEDGPQFAFAIYENGCEKLGQEQFGEELGVVLEKDIPELLVEIGKAVEAENMTYTQFRKQFPDKVIEIVKKYV